MLLKQDRLQFLNNMKNKKMTRILILSFTIICFCGTLTAQQLPHITQYTSNNYAVNPAVSGMYDYYQVNTTIRNQWVGINEAPRTSVISIYGKHTNNVSLGGTVFNDVAGPTSRSGVAASYTYSFLVTSKIKLSLALQGGFTQWKVIKNAANIQDQEDEFFNNGDVVRVLPDATFGLNVSGDKWYIGVAMPQLLSSELRLMDDDMTNYYDGSLNGKLATHIYMLGAYNFDITSIVSCEPSILFKSIAGATNVDFGVKFGYKELFWTGINSKQNNDLSALAALIGFNLNDRYSLGYSFGISNSEAGTQSHEFMLGLRLPSR